MRGPLVDQLDQGETPFEAWYWAVTSVYVESDDAFSFTLRSGGRGGATPVKADPDWSRLIFDTLERAATTGSFGG